MRAQLRLRARHRRATVTGLPAPGHERVLGDVLLELRQGLAAILLGILELPTQLPDRASLEDRLSSIDRCNSPAKHLGWFHPTECLSRAVVQLSGDGVEMCSAVKAEVGVAREVLA